MLFKELIRELGVHSTVILSTHLVEDAVNLCERILVMKQGRIVFDGVGADLATFDAEAVGGSRSRRQSIVSGVDVMTRAS